MANKYNIGDMLYWPREDTTYIIENFTTVGLIPCYILYNLDKWYSVEAAVESVDNYDLEKVA